MLFFFKQKEIHLDCFSVYEHAYNLFPVDYSHKFYPDWWKKLPKEIPYYDETTNDTKGFLNTMKGCIGLIEFYQNSITIPLWTDMLLKVYRSKDKEGYEAFFSDGMTSMGLHRVQQMEGLTDFCKYIHYKINGPWFFRCKEDIRFSWVQPIWNFNPIDQIIVPPAVVDYKYQHGTSINFFLPVEKMDKEDNSLLIESGQPMVNIFPLSDRKIKIHNHFITQAELKKLHMDIPPISFFGKYNKVKRIMKERESKCPFGFK
jgi:hypothetical protein